MGLNNFWDKRQNKRENKRENKEEDALFKNNSNTNYEETQEDDYIDDDNSGIPIEQLEYDYFDDDDKSGIDKVQIFGTDGQAILPILTDSKGRIKISSDIIIPPISFTELVIRDIETEDYIKFTKAFDLSQFTKTSFIIVNRGVNPATIQLEDSPDNSIFKLDPPFMVVEPASFQVLTPTRFIRFSRIAFRSTKASNSTKIDLFFQAQGNKVG